MKLFIDATTIRNGRSGTGVYSKHMLAGLVNYEGSQIIALGNQQLLNQSFGDQSQVQIINNTANPHLTINRDLCGNRMGIQADAAFFPNYFMPPGWPSPAAVTIHDVSFITHPWFYSQKMVLWYKHRIKHTLSHARLILTVSETSKNQLIRHLGINPDKIRIHIPAPAMICREMPSPKEKPYLVYIGNMEPRKNLFNLIKGYQAAELKNINLILIGKMHASPSWAKRFYSLVNQTPGVSYTGYLPEMEMKRYLINSRGFVNISYVEGFGISQLDALANGIPALISDDPALKEVAQGFSLITSPNDIHEIASRLHDLVSLPGHAEASSLHFQKYYSWRSYCESLDAIIHELVEKKDPVFPGFGNDNSRNVGLEQSIIAGVCYAGVFSSGIHDDKLYHSLSIQEPDKPWFRQVISKLTYKYPEQFQRKDGITALRPLDLNGHRHALAMSEKLRKNHRSLIRTLGKWPWIRAMYYSGGTMHGSGWEKKPDLDVFMVTSANRAWLTYTLIRLLSKIARHGNSFCCNYLIDESAQEIQWQRDFYTAHQMLFLRQIIRKKGTSHIRCHNKWMYTFFPNAPKFEPVNHTPSNHKTGFLYWLNMLAMILWTYRWEKYGLKNGEGGMLWDFRRIKLHTHDHRPRVYKMYATLLNNCLNRISGLYQHKEKVTT
ncbi:MAG: glycosyltransferase family 1 protein [Balneolales bacterium]